MDVLRELIDRTLREITTAKFFWLDYFDAMIEERTREIEREWKKAIFILFVIPLFTVLGLSVDSHPWEPSFISIAWVSSFLFLYLHIRVTYMEYTLKKLMTDFSNEVSSFLKPGGKGG